MKPHDAARMDVNRERQPWALHGCALEPVDNDHVNQCVVNLDKRERIVCFEGARGRREPITGGLGTIATRDAFLTGFLADASRDRLAARWCKPERKTAAANLGH